MGGEWGVQVIHLAIDLQVFFCHSVLFLFVWYYFKFFLSRKYNIFGLLDARPCRTIMKVPQKLSFGNEVCEIRLKFWLRSCPDLLLTPQNKKRTRENVWNIFRRYIYIYIYMEYVYIYIYIWNIINIYDIR